MVNVPASVLEALYESVKSPGTAGGDSATELSPPLTAMTGSNITAHRGIGIPGSDGRC